MGSGLGNPSRRFSQLHKNVFCLFAVSSLFLFASGEPLGFSTVNFSAWACRGSP